MEILLICLLVVAVFRAMKEDRGSRKFSREIESNIVQQSEIKENKIKQDVVSHRIINLSKMRTERGKIPPKFRHDFGEDLEEYTSDLVNILTGKGVKKWQTS